MHDAGRVGSGEGRGDLRPDVQSRTKRQTTSHQTVAQRLPIDMFHDDEVLPVAGLLESVDRTNVGMIEAGGGACLLLESA